MVYMGEVHEGGDPPGRAFDSFSLGELHWSENRQKERQSIPQAFKSEVFTAEQRLDHRGALFVLRAQDSRLYGERENLLKEDFCFDLVSHEPFVRANVGILFDQSNKNGIAQGSIERFDDTGALPQGMGMMLYGKVLDFIQEFANMRTLPITHIVQRVPTFSSKKDLSPERWSELFLPLLETKGYQRISNDYWAKEYHTKTSQQET